MNNRTQTCPATAFSQAREDMNNIKIKQRLRRSSSTIFMLIECFPCLDSGPGFIRFKVFIEVEEPGDDDKRNRVDQPRPSI